MPKPRRIVVVIATNPAASVRENHRFCFIQAFINRIKDSLISRNPRSSPAACTRLNRNVLRRIAQTDTMATSSHNLPSNSWVRRTALHTREIGDAPYKVVGLFGLFDERRYECNPLDHKRQSNTQGKNWETGNYITFQATCPGDHWGNYEYNG